MLEELGPAVLRAYADPKPLEEAYAAYLGTDPARVVATTGADDAIDRVFRAFLAPDQDAVFPTPTFIMVPAFARMAGGRLVPIEYDWGTLPHDRILEAVTDRTGVVVVISPDNPTGMAFPTDALVRLAGDLPPGGHADGGPGLRRVRRDRPDRGAAEDPPRCDDPHHVEVVGPGRTAGGVCGRVEGSDRRVARIRGAVLAEWPVHRDRCGPPEPGRPADA